MTEYNHLYDFIFPDSSLCAEEGLYFHATNASYSPQSSQISIKAGGCLDLLSYFNGFSAAKWHKYTNIRKLAVSITIIGRCHAEIVRLNTTPAILRAYDLHSDERKSFILAVGELPAAGILGVRLYGTGPCNFFCGSYLTGDRPLRIPHTALCITTHKREDAVKASVRRLGRAFAQSQENGRIDIIVTDNGNTLSSTDVPAATLLKNRNLGGTGGFMRALAHCQDQGKYSHCLFMDDDARCEAGSIFRSIKFLAHATDPGTAIAGAMLYDSEPWKQWENGAWFDGTCHSLNRDLDLRLAANLSGNEDECQKPIYGPWWFFLFPLNYAKKYAFPFFVRGDDIDFSYANDFKIVALNGVGAWQEDFRTKAGALTTYLIARSYIVHFLNMTGFDNSFANLRVILTKMFNNCNDSWCYGEAAAINLAIAHVLSGPDFWRENITMEKIMPQISALQLQFSPLDEECIGQPAKPLPKNIRDKWQKCSLNGHLLPGFMLADERAEYLPKTKCPARNVVFGRKRLLLVDEVGKRKATIQRKPINHVYNKTKFYFLLLILKYKYYRLKKEYNYMTDIMRTNGWWKNIYSDL